MSNQVISFSTGDIRHTVRLSITSDDICESPYENFFVSIALVSSRVPITISTSNTTVLISDVDEQECGEFAQDTKSLINLHTHLYSII